MKHWCHWLLVIFLLTGCSALPGKKAAELRPDGWWTSHDGKKMPWRAWLPPAGTSTRGVLIAVHGLSGASSDFWLLGDRLPKLGYAVYSYELRGQGYDVPGERGDIASARLWQQDLATFHKLVQKRHRRAPVVWFGESLGSLITLHTAVDWTLSSEPEAMIVSAPVAGLRLEMGELEKMFLKASSRIVPTMRVTLGGISGVDESKMRVTQGANHAEQMSKTPHHVGAFSLRLLREAGALIEANLRAARKLRVPVLMLATPHDIVARPDQVQDLFRALTSKDKKLLWYTRSYHLLLHDVQREEVLTDVTRWLDRIIDK